MPLPNIDISVPITALRVGAVAPLAGINGDSAIRKYAVDNALHLDAQGVAGDTQADRLHHGGAERALCHYPCEHYTFWRARYAGFDSVLEPGVLGENINTQSVTEADVCVGDIFTLGETVIQIAQPRMPCRTIDARTGIKGLARAVIAAGRAGWLYRVLEPGAIRAGDSLERIQRAAHGITLAELWRTFNARQPDAAQHEQIQTLAGLTTLAPAWRKTLSTIAAKHAR